MAEKEKDKDKETAFTEALGLETKSEDTYQVICLLRERLATLLRPIPVMCSKSSSTSSTGVPVEEMPPLATILNKVKLSELRNLEALRDIYHGLKV